MADVGGALKGAGSGAAAGAAFGPWGAVIGGAIGLAGSLIGGNKAAKQRKRMEQYLNKQESDATAWYNANALSDYTQRADTQALIKNMRDNMSQQNRIASNTAVVTGATPEQQAVQKEQSNKVMTDTYSRIGAMGQQYKDQVTDKYLAMKNNIAQQRMDLTGQKAGSYENLMGNGMDLMSGTLQAFATMKGGGAK